MILRMLTGLSDWLSIRSAKVRFFFQLLFNTFGCCMLWHVVKHVLAD